MKDLKNISSEEQLRELGLFSSQKRKVGVTSLLSTTALRKLHQGGVGLFCHVSRERMRGNGLKLQQGRFRLDVRKKNVY